MTGWGSSVQILVLALVLIASPLLPVFQARFRSGWARVVLAPVCYLVISLAAIAALGVRVGGVAPVDWLGGVCLGVAVSLGWLQVWSVLHRGFSLQLMVEIEKQALSRTELAEKYAGGRGLQWMLEKRLSGLVELGLLEFVGAHGDGREADAFRLTSRGRWVARVAETYKSLLRMGAGG